MVLNRKIVNRKYRALQSIEYEGARHIEESSFFYFLILRRKDNY